MTTFVLLIIVFAGGTPAISTDIRFTDRDVCAVAAMEIAHRGGIGEPTIATDCLEVK